MSQLTHDNIATNKTTAAVENNHLPVQDNVEFKYQKQFTPIDFQIQPKLAIGAVDDPLEHEADAMADKVMRMPEPFIQRKCKECEEEDKKIQRKESVSATPSVTPAVEKTLQSAGQTMDNPTRSFMEERFGHDFSNVQIHNDAVAHQSAADINALAYTNSNHVVFGEGQYQPHTDSGKQLLAHELTHVVQQSSFIQRKSAFNNTNENGSAVNSLPAAPLQNDLLQKDEIKEKQSERKAAIQIANPPDAPAANNAVTVADTVMRMPKQSFMQQRHAVTLQAGKIQRRTVEEEDKVINELKEEGVNERIIQAKFANGASFIQRKAGDGLPSNQITSVVQQNGAGTIQRKPGDVSEPVVQENSGDINLDIYAVKSAYHSLTKDNLLQAFVVTGNTGRLYIVEEYKDNYATSVIGTYAIRSIDFPYATLLLMPDNKFSVLGAVTVEQPDGSAVFETVFMGWKTDTPENRKLGELADKELNMDNWFTNEAEKKDYYSKSTTSKFAVLFVPPVSGKTAGGSGGEEEVKPPMPQWMGAYKDEMQKLIAAAKIDEKFATDIPDKFFVYYSRDKGRWRAGASQATADAKKTLDVYVDIAEKDVKKDKLQEIRDQVRIKQLSNPTAFDKNAKPLDPKLSWATRLKLEVDMLIEAERKLHPDNAALPDKIAVVTSPDDATLPFLQLWKYIATSDSEGNVSHTLKSGVMSSPLIQGTNPQQLFEAVKKTMLAILGEDIKPVNENPKDYKTILEAFPANLKALNVREDFRSVTGAKLELQMNLTMGVLPGMDLLTQASTIFRGIIYAWDVYRISEVMPDEEQKKLSADWKERRKELQAWFKNSGQLKDANPASGKTVRSYDATETVDMPMTEGEYVIYGHAVVEPYENVFRLPSEAFFTVKLLDGYKLAKEISDERLTQMEEIRQAIIAEKDPGKKKKLQEKLDAIAAQEKRTLTQAADVNAGSQEDLKSLAAKLNSYYLIAGGREVPDLLEEDLKKHKISQEYFDKLLDLWMYVETSDVSKKPQQQLKDIITSAEKNLKQIRELKERAGKFSGDLEGYEILPAPVVGLVSRVTGQPYPLLLTMGMKEDADGTTHVMLVDVTTEETMGKYTGSSKLGLWSATQEAFNNFGEKCKYGEGYIAYRLPGKGVSGYADSSPGLWERVKSILGKVAAVAGIVALIVGTIFTGGALAVVAGWVGVGALVVGGALAVENIYDRAVNHRLHADVELAMDILNIAGPVLQGAGALVKLSSVSTLTKLVKAAETAGELSSAEKGVMTVAAIAKLENLVMIGKTLTIIQKGEAITNLGLVGYKTYKDLAMVAEVYADDPAKMRAMQAEIIKNALIAGTFALIALKNEFKLRSPEELDGLVNTLIKEKDYDAAMIKSGIKDAAGNWKDPKLKEYFLGKGKEALENLNAPKKEEETPAGTAKGANGEETGKHVPDKYEKDRRVEMKGHAETPDKLHDVEAYPDGTVGRCSSVAGAKCPLLQVEFKEVIAERPVLKKRLDDLTKEIGAFGENVPKAKMDELAALEQRMRLLEMARNTSSAPKDYKILEIGYNDDVDLPLLREKTMIEYPNGERVWRGADNGIYHEGTIKSSIGRQGMEHEFYTGTETGLATMKGTERAHSFGQGFGWESPYGLLNAPRFVNQKLQNNGIEQYVRTLRDLLPAGQQIVLRTNTKAVPGTRRLQSISYEGFIMTASGEKIPAFSYEINVSWKSSGGSVVDAAPMQFETSSNPAHQKVLTDTQALIPSAKMPDYVVRPIHEDITVK